MKYRTAKDRPKEVEVWTSKIHRNGLFACQAFNPKDIVIEYVGEKIRNALADKREIVYNDLGIGDCYMFRLNKDYVIDATFYGNKARYLNHSCDANCYADVFKVNDELHIVLMASR
jgi:histone-lysine N-methyltransferase SETD1